jgi:hypothetical protein
MQREPRSFWPSRRLLLVGGVSSAAKPETSSGIVIAGSRAILVAERPVAAAEESTDKIWPTEEASRQAQTSSTSPSCPALNDSDQSRVHDITGGSRNVAAIRNTPARRLRISDPHHPGEARVDVRKHYMMNVECAAGAGDHPVLAAAGASYSGKVEFSDQDARQK